MDLSVVIPAYNEQSRLEKTLDILLKFLGTSKKSYELIISDDGSTDDTLKVAQKWAKKFSQIKVLSSPHGNQGKGDAVKRGVLHSSGKLVLFVDADNAVPITELPKLMSFIEEFPVVVGSKHMPTSVSLGSNQTRRLLSYLGHLAISLFAVPDVHDTQCGFKLFQAEAAKQIFQRIKMHRFGFDIEIFVIARNLGLAYKEVGITWSADEDSRVRPIHDAINTIFELMKIVINQTTGKYK